MKKSYQVKLTNGKVYGFMAHTMGELPVIVEAKLGIHRNMIARMWEVKPQRSRKAARILALAA